MARTGRPRKFDLDSSVEAAMLLFWESGYDATSLAQLRAAMGLSSASFYATFGSKEGVFDAAVQRYIGSYGRVTLPLAAVDLEPREAMEKTLRGSVIMQTDPAHPLGCLIGLGSLIAGADENRRAALETRRTFDRENMAALVERAIAVGKLEPRTSIEALATMLHSFLLGLTPLARDGVDAETLQDSVTEMMRFWDSMYPGSEAVDR
ncbi:TetR/AcrR family transcriptional regulator [Rhodococcus sp. G-MC3]|uniref:TetR/AcrR family transcriptional regulator n=1 Tax=Rhodococcus sp. G-MC3 TaxID=3046209 RepID=UPI0024BB2D17|nr:TetR/AcrR family transcriptional regulator [Rhodococcus sp. G-MC3]MDJ0396672.1 TetR/AcrR family transcriptional regulator [Rhodococcus sp. G-MC3]